MEFFKYLFIFFLVLIGLGYILRWLIIRWVRKVQKNFTERSAPHREEGDVTIKDNTKNKKFHNTGDGEYVDYEEVE